VCAYDSDESIPDKLEYVMQNNVTVTIDPEGIVPELNEMNNSMTVEIGPTATQPSTWGAIKSLYR
jgi:subtilase family serine protease